MFERLRTVLLVVTLAILLTGTLIAVVVINATAGGPTPDLTSPAAMALATRSLPPDWVVRAGDTFDSIAASNHLSDSQLQALNPRQDPTALVPGQHLLLHLPKPGVPVARPVPPPFWTVRSGETYTSIAAKTGVDAATIAGLNPKANPNLLVPGQRLKLRP